MVIYDLQEQRQRALERVRAALEDMLITLDSTLPDTPARERAEGMVRRLRSTEARLEAGLPKDQRL